MKRYSFANMNTCYQIELLFQESWMYSKEFWLTFSILYFSSACVAQSTASCCISSLISAFLMTALRSDILAAYMCVCVIFPFLFQFIQWKKKRKSKSNVTKHCKQSDDIRWCKSKIPERKLRIFMILI